MGDDMDKDRSAPLFDLATWLVSFDDPDPMSDGFQARRVTSMRQIIERARDALLASGMCGCGNRLDGDNLCMRSACEREA